VQFFCQPELLNAALGSNADLVQETAGQIDSGGF
jgi:hypothetical protein